MLCFTRFFLATLAFCLLVGVSSFAQGQSTTTPAATKDLSQPFIEMCAYSNYPYTVAYSNSSNGCIKNPQNNGYYFKFTDCTATSITRWYSTNPDCSNPEGSMTAVNDQTTTSAGCSGQMLRYHCPVNQTYAPTTTGVSTTTTSAPASTAGVVTPSGRDLAFPYIELCGTSNVFYSTLGNTCIKNPQNNGYYFQFTDCTATTIKRWYSTNANCSNPQGFVNEVNDQSTSSSGCNGVMRYHCPVNQTSGGVTSTALTTTTTTTTTAVYTGPTKDLSQPFIEMCASGSYIYTVAYPTSANGCIKNPQNNGYYFLFTDCTATSIKRWYSTNADCSSPQGYVTEVNDQTTTSAGCSGSLRYHCPVGITYPPTTTITTTTAVYTGPTKDLSQPFIEMCASGSYIYTVAYPTSANGCIKNPQNNGYYFQFTDCTATSIKRWYSTNSDCSNPQGSVTEVNDQTTTSAGCNGQTLRYHCPVGLTYPPTTTTTTVAIPTPSGRDLSQSFIELCGTSNTINYPINANGCIKNPQNNGYYFYFTECTATTLKRYYTTNADCSSAMGPITETNSQATSTSGCFGLRYHCPINASIVTTTTSTAATTATTAAPDALGPYDTTKPYILYYPNGCYSGGNPTKVAYPADSINNCIASPENTQYSKYYFKFTSCGASTLSRYYYSDSNCSTLLGGPYTESSNGACSSSYMKYFCPNSGATTSSSGSISASSSLTKWIMLTMQNMTNIDARLPEIRASLAIILQIPKSVLTLVKATSPPNTVMVFFTTSSSFTDANVTVALSKASAMDSTSLNSLGAASATTSDSAAPPSGSNVGGAVGGSIGGLLVIGLIVVAAILYKKKQDEERQRHLAAAGGNAELNMMLMNGNNKVQPMMPMMQMQTQPQFSNGVMAYQQPQPVMGQPVAMNMNYQQHEAILL